MSNENEKTNGAIAAFKKMNPGILEDQSKALGMQRDGFTPAQIAEVLGYQESQIVMLLGEKVEVGSPEQILQECLRTTVNLIPVAEAMYRASPGMSHAQALTGFINCAKDLIAEQHSLKSKEEVFKDILQKVLNPFCREMIKGMLAEVTQLKISGVPEEELQKFSKSLGVKFREAYRKGAEELGDVLGIGADAKARILTSTVANE